MVDCDTNIQIANDFILSRGKNYSEILDSLGEGANNDFGNKYPFIDDERSIVSPTDEESENLMSVEQMKKLDTAQLQELASEALSDVDYEQACGMLIELLERDYDNQEAHHLLLKVFNELGFRNVLVTSTKDKLRSILIDKRHIE